MAEMKNICGKIPVELHEKVRAEIEERETSTQIFIRQKVKLEGYRLTFCGRGKGCGVATILPEEGSRVEGVLWKITPECEKSLDFYEGYPHLYGKETVLVQGKDGVKREVMAYTMNAPYKDQPAIPSDLYFMGIVEGCHQNGISSRSVTDALKRTRQEVGKKKASHKKTEVSR